MSNEQLLPTILEPINRDKLLKLAAEAGENHLSPAQMSVKFGLAEKEVQILWYRDPAIAMAYAQAHLEQQIQQLETLKRIANDGDHKAQFAAAKLLYEIFSGYKQTTTFNISINNNPATIRTESSLRLTESVDAEILEKVQHD